MKIFNRHRVRSTFYHTISAAVVITTILYFTGFISGDESFLVTSIAFFVDYAAEMFDPHPTNPGPWYKRYFHRFYDGEEE